MSDKKYIEFKGFKNQRIAYGLNAGFLIVEVTKNSPVSLSNGDLIESGCMVYMHGFPAMGVKDFYLNVVDNVEKLGTIVDRLKDVHEKSEG